VVDGEKPGVDFGDEGKHTVQSLAANKTLPALLATITSFTAQDGYGIQAYDAETSQSRSLAYVESIRQPI